MDPLANWNQSRLNQLNEMDDLQHSLRGLLGSSCVARPQNDAAMPDWIPVVEVSEDARGYVIKVELPQVKREDVKIIIETGTLTITGERKFDQNSKKNHPRSLACGRFMHCFAVPSDARPCRITTLFRNEILTVHLVRNQKATLRRTTAAAPSARQARGSATQNINKNKTKIENAIVPTKKPQKR
jgi:HSP20 family protein